ncbi:hypothetical protein C2S53_003725 [Perilla frutescens var. hirtella]|uniref:Uncharacterized protein n=1 Tax=Perilla frutescens var. hirtella TaxID=608512 RepID=A0AAD4P4A8_PERFH|nr:hypothetical protein C2S53_003725 [Perilla frutescens var. hirtella]
MASAQSIFLQEPSCKWKSCSYHSPQLPPPNSFASSHIKNLKKISINCLFTNDGSAANQRSSEIGFGKLEIKQSPVEVVTVTTIMKASLEPEVAALLLMYNSNSASGGRVGGYSFPSRSYSTRRMGAGSVSYSAPYFYGLSRFLYVPIIAFLPRSILYIIVSVVALGYLEDFFSGSQGLKDFLSKVSQRSVLTATEETRVPTATEKTSVLKLQLHVLLDKERSVQKELNQIAETAETSTTEGIHHVLTETLVVLLRHPEYFLSAYTSVDEKSSSEEGERAFNKLSIKERVKFDMETLVSINKQKRSPSAPSKVGIGSEYIVITILVAARGELMLPSITNINELKEALLNLGSISVDRTMAVEVLWTTQN